MKTYFLVRESVPIALAALAAIDRKDLPEILGWLTGGAEVEYCLLDDQEFERAKTLRGAIVLSSKRHDGKEVAIAFAPDVGWPEEFRGYRNYFDEMERRAEEQENITEETWLNCDTRPIDLANFALPSLSTRKIRLFAVACCDLVADRMIDPGSRRAVEVALRHADGTASDEDLKTAMEGANDAHVRSSTRAYGPVAAPDQISPEYGAAALACNAASPIDRSVTPDRPDGWLSICAAGTVSDFLIWHTIMAAREDPLINAKITGLLRDICGNPFRPVVADPALRSARLKSMAREIYDLKAFGRLPALAAMLEEMGCEDQLVMDHCRGAGPHTRGCWALELMLGHDARDDTVHADRIKK